jgi:hypothetical protein
MKRRPTFALFALVLATSLVGASCTGGTREPSHPRAGGLEGEASIEEAQEQREAVEAHHEAIADAREAGTLGLIEPVTRATAPGWAGETVANATADDWEPAIAADPNAPWVYVLITRFGVPACSGGNCPDPAMVLRVSKDGGKTWGRDSYVCTCRRVGSQFDPQIEVVPKSGDVYALWMNDWHIVFAKSTDHGKTWSRPVPVYGKLTWSDKPAMTTSQNGTDVYVSFNGPFYGDPYVTVSHDAGVTWSPIQVTSSDRYYFAYQGVVAPDGTVTFAEMSETYTGPGDASEGPVYVHAISSTDGGATWTDTVVDQIELGAPCTSEWCYADFYDGHAALAGDADGDLVIAYDGAIDVGGPRRIWTRSSTDGGLTWSDRVKLSPADSNAGFPAAAGTGNDGVRLWFADQRTGRWNVWYRTSKDLGASWSKAVRISDATGGTAYKNAAGFIEFYGDYGEIAVTSAGKTVAVWPEAISYRGPGGVWFNRER